MDDLTLTGRCFLRAWKRGEIPAMLNYGLPLRRAKEVAEAEGSLVDCWEVSNLIVSAGKYLAGDLLLGVDTIGLTVHAIGSSSTAVTAADTALNGEANRKYCSVRSRSLAVLTLDTFYLASESTYFIRECGVFGGVTATLTANSGRLFSHFLLSYDNTGGLNDLTFEYQLTIG